MKTQLQKASTGYTTVEDMLDTEDICWNFITFLWKLDIIRYGSDGLPDASRGRNIYHHQKGLVSMWYRLHTE